jgi:hypothetical protein
MAKRRPDQRGSAETEVLEVRVTKVKPPTRPARPHRSRRPLIAIIAVVAGLAPGVWILARSGSSPPAAARTPGARGVAGAYGYPPRCLSITIPADAPTYARADFDRGQSCGRYDGSTTAIFHRSAGAWRVVLDAATYPCPVASIPLPVQDELGVCDVSGR